MRAAMVACTVAGTLTSAASVGRHVGAAVALQHAALGQIAHDLLGEKRVTGGPFDDHGAPTRQPRGPARAARRPVLRSPNHSAAQGRWFEHPAPEPARPSYSGR